MIKKNQIRLIWKTMFLIFEDGELGRLDTPWN